MGAQDEECVRSCVFETLVEAPPVSRKLICRPCLLGLSSRVRHSRGLLTREPSGMICANLPIYSWGLSITAATIILLWSASDESQTPEANLSQEIWELMITK
jgi:hypothetical protein